MNTRWPLSILVLSTTVLASAVIPVGAQPPHGAVRGPAHGDGGVSEFYAWKDKVPRAPGTLLRQEPLPDQLMLTNAAKGLRVLYTSTDGIDGKTRSPYPARSIFRRGPRPPAAGRWWRGRTARRARRRVRTLVDGAWARDTDYLNAWLAQGYAVVASDYQGLGTPGGHPWMAVRPEGWSVLDSVRSALVGVSGIGERGCDRRTVAGVACRAVRCGAGPGYAPTLRIRGTVATGVAGPQYAASRRTSAFLFLLLHKFQAMDPAFRPSDYLTEAGQRGYAAAATTCVRPGPTFPWRPC